MQGVFKSTGKILLGHCFFTWIWFSYYSIKYLYLYTFLSGILAVFTLISPWMLAIIPYLMLYAMSSGLGFISVLIFFMVYCLDMNLIDGFLSEANVRASS